MTGGADAGIHIVGHQLVEDQQVDGALVADLGQLGDFVGAAAEADPSQKMLDALFSSCHGSDSAGAPRRSRQRRTTARVVPSAWRPTLARPDR